MTRPMKHSGVDWLGDIPADWNVTKVLNGLAMPITDGPHITPELHDDGIAFVSAEAVSCGNGKIDFSHIRGYISEEFYQECCKKYVPAINDIYMIKSGATTGRVAIVDTLEPVFTIWSPLAVFRCNEKILLSKYLYYQLQADSFQRQVELNWTYGTQQNIGMRSIEKLIVAVPPIDEQKRIAAYLDDKCGRIDSVISKTRATVAEYKKLKQAVITRAVTRGIRPARAMKQSGIDWIGEMNSNYSLKRIKYFISDYKAGPFGSALITGNLLNNGNILVYTPEHVAKQSDNISNNFFLPDNRREEMQQFFVETGHIVFPIVGSLGRAMYITSTMREGIINQRLAKFKLNEKVVDKNFFMYVFAKGDFYKQFLEVNSRGAIIVNLTKEIVHNMLFPLPPIDEQREIAAYLDEKTSAIDSLVAKKNQLVAELERLKKSLIFEYVTGKKEVAQ